MSKVFWSQLADVGLNDPGSWRLEHMVQRLARESCPAGQCPIEPVLTNCVHDAVHHLWSTSRITGYVPVLALKRVQDCIRAGTCDIKHT